jgi:hypothetical protein
MSIESTVLSLSLDRQKLAEREFLLQANNFTVVSVNSGAQAHFEIMMGRCGIFLTCDQVSAAENRDLMSLFRKSCKTGWIILIAQEDTESIGADRLPADIWIRESDDPHAIVPYLLRHSRKAG